MSLKVISTFALVLPALCNGFILDSFRNQSNWNGLKATWALNPFSAFKSYPRLQQEAVAAGWVPMGQPGCSGSSLFLGTRYWKDNDMGIILIYDTNGYIAGIQAGFSKTFSPNPHNYPFPPLINSPLVLEGDHYFITAYFVDPASLCSGRSKARFDSEGTGTGLWIQNGTNPITQSIKIPATQDEADKSMWTKGLCFASMGVHYWYNISLDMNCDNLYPVFLLYNKGVLNAFGWAFGAEITSKYFEHPAEPTYGLFMKQVPKCLPNLGTLTTLHIYDRQRRCGPVLNLNDDLKTFPNSNILDLSNLK